MGPAAPRGLTAALVETIGNVKHWGSAQWMGLVFVLLAFGLPRVMVASPEFDDALDHLAVVGAAMLAGKPKSKARFVRPKEPRD